MLLLCVGVGDGYAIGWNRLRGSDVGSRSSRITSAKDAFMVVD